MARQLTCMGQDGFFESLDETSPVPDSSRLLTFIRVFHPENGRKFCIIGIRLQLADKFADQHCWFNGIMKFFECRLSIV